MRPLEGLLFLTYLACDQASRCYRLILAIGSGAALSSDVDLSSGAAFSSDIALSSVVATNSKFSSRACLQVW